MGTPDTDLAAVCAAFEAQRAAGLIDRTASMLRSTIDQLLDGVHTGRYQWSQLYKTEKTHAGTLVEINLRREFKDFIVDGEKLDYRVAGIDVDCKFSQGEFGWMFPPEAVGEICLVMWASDEKALWSMGLLRITESVLSTGKGNRDGKRTLLAENRDRIIPLATRAVLPGNVYLSLPQSTVQHILDEKASGQERINRLFRSAQGKLIGRGAIATAGQQDDFMKRVRENGGARSRLQPEGIVILGHEHHAIAAALNLPIPAKGQMVSATVVPAAKGAPNTAEIDGGRWMVGDTALRPAPRLPRAASPSAIR